MAKKLFEYIEHRRNNKRYVVAVAGESGSGKSVLSHCLASEYKKLNIKAKPLHTDNYYLTLPEERTAWRKLHGPESIGTNEYDWNTLNSNVAAFRKGLIAKDMPCVELLTNTVDLLTTDFAPIDVLIVEGLYALLIDDADLRVFIDIPYTATLKAQSMRGKETLDEFRTTVLEREHQEVVKTKRLADVIIDKF